MKHNFRKIEAKWQQKWEDAKIFRAVDGSPKPKFYGLVEFPYPSGAGMHVGHIKAYSSLEVISRREGWKGIMSCSPSGLTRLVCLRRIMRLKRARILGLSRTKTLRNLRIS